MTALDEHVNEWLKEKFLQSSHYYPATMGEPEDISVLEADMGWECGCYSEFTRDDTFVFRAKIRKGDGTVFEWSYGHWWDLPSFIEELDEYINDSCPYSEED
jgi:hypothetical protein